MRKAVRKLSAIRSGLGTWTWYFVMLLKIGSWSTSWKPSSPRPLLIADGVMTTIGECAWYAHATAVTMFVMPGPFCPAQTPGVPLTLA